MGITNAIMMPYHLESILVDSNFSDIEGFDMRRDQLQDCLIKAIFSVSGSSIFSKFDRIGKEENTQFIKYDLVMKQNIFDGIDSERLGSAKNDAEGYMMAQ